MLVSRLPLINPVLTTHSRPGFGLISFYKQQLATCTALLSSPLLGRAVCPYKQPQNYSPTRSEQKQDDLVSKSQQSYDNINRTESLSIFALIVSLPLFHGTRSVPSVPQHSSSSLRCALPCRSSPLSASTKARLRPLKVTKLECQAP